MINKLYSENEITELVKVCANLRKIARETENEEMQTEICKTVLQILRATRLLIERLSGLENLYHSNNDALINAIRDHEERLSELEDNTGAFDPVTDVPGVAELMWKVAEETDDKELKKNIWCSFIDHSPDITERMNKGIDEMKTAVAQCGVSTAEVMNAFEAANGTDLESAQYDEELEGYKYSAAEIAQKLNVLSQYCDVELKDTCTVKDIANFLEHVELDVSGNVWLNLQVDERTIKRFRLNREAAGQITM